MTVPASLNDQLTLAPRATAGRHEIPVGDANELLVRWGHYLGACNRPFGQQAWVLVEGRLFDLGALVDRRLR